MAAATFSCCKAFILVNDAKSTPCFCNSLPTVSKSLFKAAVLAFSRLSCLPVKSSASNSALILLSKSNNLPCIPSMSFKVAPNSLAAAADFTNAAGFADNEACNPLEALAASFNKSLTVAVVLLVWMVSLATSTKLPNVSSVAGPCNLNTVVRFAASEPAIPNLSVKFKNVSADWDDISKITPASVFKSKNDFCNFWLLTKISLVAPATFTNSFLKAKEFV